MKRVKTKAKAEKARRKPTEVTDYKPAGLIWYDFTKEPASASFCLELVLYFLFNLRNHFRQVVVDHAPTVP
jgi:hypothetical protein